MQDDYKPIQLILEKAGYRYSARIGDDNSDCYLWWMPNIPGHTLESFELTFAEGARRTLQAYESSGKLCTQRIRKFI